MGCKGSTVSEMGHERALNPRNFACILFLEHVEPLREVRQVVGCVCKMKH